MPDSLPKRAVLDQEFLSIRAKILEVGAMLDRLDRGGGSVADDPRLAQIQGAIAILASDEPNRAERIQLNFSLPYHEDWQAQFAQQGWGNGKVN